MLLSGSLEKTWGRLAGSSLFSEGGITEFCSAFESEYLCECACGCVHGVCAHCLPPALDLFAGVR